MTRVKKSKGKRQKGEGPTSGRLPLDLLTSGLLGRISEQQAVRGARRNAGEAIQRRGVHERVLEAARGAATARQRARIAGAPPGDLRGQCPTDDRTDVINSLRREKEIK